MAPRAKQLSLFDRSILKAAVVDSFVKLAPQRVWKNPVMFVVEVGSVCTTGISRDFLKAKCKRVARAKVPADWRKAIGL